ncbi:S1 family peptidase [Paracoccus beibuensis]|uniref:S1 family peptidase n=1 Tax=Paracoccus beibuensis TaxID=547602 RepID=UPI00223ECC5C|nr:serine protease [Paracoccus beibuensis]
MTSAHRLAAALALAGLSVPAAADPLDQTLVHIECHEPGGRQRAGTGVVISPDGMVLTARHVVAGAGAVMPAGTVCTGSLGHAGGVRATLTPQKVSTEFDAAVLKYPGLAGAEHLAYCDVQPRHKRAQVIAAGFPLVSATGQPSERMGILSTIEPGGIAAPGLLESDAATTSGMSGGRVTLDENGQLIGIVAGVTPDPTTGYPNAYAVLSAGSLAGEFGRFGLRTDPARCEPVQAVVSPQAASGVTWRAADGPLPLGVRADEGFCYLVRIWGSFEDPRDAVEISVSPEGEYVLSGHDPAASGNHGAVAQCVRF